MSAAPTEATAHGPLFACARFLGETSARTEVTNLSLSDSKLWNEGAHYRDVRVKEGFMTIAEELIQKGRQQGLAEGRAEGLAEGRAEGRLQGRILGLQIALGLPPTSSERLDELDAEGLNAILRELQAEAYERGTH